MEDFLFSPFSSFSVFFPELITAVARDRGIKVRGDDIFSLRIFIRSLIIDNRIDRGSTKAEFHRDLTLSDITALALLQQLQVQ